MVVFSYPQIYPNMFAIDLKLTIGRVITQICRFSVFATVIAVFCTNPVDGRERLFNVGKIPTITIDTAPPPMFPGRWDFIPTIASDSLPAKVQVTPRGDIWIAGNGGVLRRKTGSDVTLVERWASGRVAPIPTIISHDMIMLGDDLLISTIWREIFLASPDGLTELNSRDIRGSFSFAALPDGRLAIGLDDWRLDAGFENRMAKALGRPIIVIKNTQRLTMLGGRLFAANRGEISEIDLKTGKAQPAHSYTANSDAVASFRPTSNGLLLVAMTPHYDNGGCFIVTPGSEPAAQQIFDGACYDLIETAPGEYWASTAAGVFRFDRVSWRMYFSNAPNGIGRAARFALTKTGSLWVATSDGLWRHYLHTTELPTIATDRLTALLRTRDGRLFVGDSAGAVTVLEEGEWRIVLPPAAKSQPYSRVPLLFESANGVVWILHANGLYLATDGTAVTRQADAPITSRPNAPAALAVCPDAAVYLGFVWSSSIERLVNGSWEVDHSLHGNIGGAAISDLICDADGYLWALGSDTVAVRTPAGAWLETDVFPLRSNAKKNSFGALTLRSGQRAVIAWGAWGYPVSVQFDGQQLIAETENVTNDTPYVFHDATMSPDGAEFVLTDRGVFLRNSDGFKRVALIDERLQRRTTAFAITPDTESAFGFRLDLAAENALFAVKPPRHIPSLSLTKLPPSEISEPYISLSFDLDGRAYPPSEGELRVRVDPPIDESATRIAEPDGEFTLTGLSPDVLYAIEAQFIDLAGQVSDPVHATLTYVRPWSEDPRILAAGVLAVLISLFIVVRSPVALDLILRRLGRRRWRILLGNIDRTISLSTDDQGRLNAVLSAAGAPLRLSAVSETGAFPFNDLRQKLRSLNVLAPETRTPAGREIFSKTLDGMTNLLTQSLPTEMRFELQSFNAENLLFDVSRELSDMPWDNLIGSNNQPIFARTAVSRVIRTDRIAEHEGPTGRLCATLFVAEAGTPLESNAWHDEQQALAKVMRHAGILDVRTRTGVTDLSDVHTLLEGVDVLHLLGHASATETGNKAAQFWLTPSIALEPESLTRLLNKIKRPPSLIFINACGSLEEQQDLGGSAIAGLATPFLERGATVIGSQWPVQTVFATELATEFYSLALPPPNAMIWRWLNRSPLEGRPFADALGVAKRKLHARSPYTDPTWSAYSIYGNPTARLSLS